MKALLDACVLYPTVLRQMLLGTARAGLYRPVWSARILEEWARAAGREAGAAGELLARGEIALLRAAWPGAEVAARAGDLARLCLPDPGDIHVLGAAIAAGADLIVTENRRDFPRHILAAEGLGRMAADPFLLSLYNREPDKVREVSEAVRAEAERLSGQRWALRPLLRKARLPRLGKALERPH